MSTGTKEHGTIRHLPELLAPAGSPAALTAALAAGADAVYLSGKRFGARRSATNFTDNEIGDGIRRAHALGVRVYVTVNTLIHDRELEGVADYLLFLSEAGADAVLVQDAGVAALAREIVPGLALHASTQMTVHNTEGVLRAAEQGFSRVVLPRELGLDEIASIARKTRAAGIGLEVFAHGALCYSYSGQCLLSSVIGGRSGNRGTCAQPCRKPYTLVTGEEDRYGRPLHLRDLPQPGRYLLSPKDLCTYRHLPELVKSPVVSLKIEGRMRSPEYVAIVVSTYRNALNAIAAGMWKPDPAAERDLLLAFNRGFTAGYLFGERFASLMARDAPDNRGIVIGTVTGRDSEGTVTIRPCGDLVPVTGDGLLFSDPVGKGEEQGFSLNNTPRIQRDGTYSIIAPGPVTRGMVVSITSSRDLETRARQIIARPPGDYARKVPLDLAVTVGEDGQVDFAGTIHPGGSHAIPLQYRPAFRMAKARSHPVTGSELEDRLRKSGDTQFAIRTLSLQYPEGMFAPVGELNRMRREFLLRAEEAVVASFLPREEATGQARKRLAVLKDLLRAPCGGPAQKRPAMTLTIAADTPEAVTAALREGCDRIWYETSYPVPAHRCDAGDDVDSPGSRPGPVLTACRDAGIPCLLQFPRISRDTFLDGVLPEIPDLFRAGLTGCQVEDAGTARAVRSGAPGIAIGGGPGLNVFNHLAALTLATLFSSLTLSPELSGDECRDLVCRARSRGCTTPFSLIVQGPVEAMITEDCLLESVQKCRPTHGSESGNTFFGIRDSTGHIFPVRTDGSCRTLIGNAAETCLLDHLPAIARAGISDVVIDARDRPAAYAGETTRIYREALDSIAAGTPFSKERLASLKEEIRARARGGITAGHFVRGLKE